MTIIKDQVHIITSVERRRRWSIEEKRSIAQETCLPGMSVSLIARKHGINPSQLFSWRRLMEEGASRRYPLRRRRGSQGSSQRTRKACSGA